MHACSVTSVMSDSVTPWTVASKAPLSMEFSRQVYWNGLPFPTPGNLPDPGFKPVSPALISRFFTIAPPGKPLSFPSHGFLWPASPLTGMTF